LSLLPGSDREWIVWMHENYYDTSIAGDGRLLGWHVNKIDLMPVGNQDVPIPRASEFHPMIDYAERLYRPQVINDVIRTADPAGVLARLDQGIPVVRKPPQVRLARMVGQVPQALVGNQLAVPDQTVTLQIQAEAAEGGRIRSIAVYNGPMPYPLDEVPPPAQEFQSINKQILLWRRDNPLIVEATDDQGVKGRAELLVRVTEPPPPPPRPELGPRLMIASFGAESFSGDLPQIPFADSDVNQIDAFLAKPGGRARFERIDHPGLAAGGVRNAPATTSGIGKTIDQLVAEAKQKRLGRGHTVFLVIDSHVLSCDKDGPMLVLGPGARRGQPGQAGIPTAKITEALKYLTGSGCFVVLFLDGIHTKLGDLEWKGFRTWVRELRDQARVVVCVASKQDPSEQLEGEGIGVFAKAVRESIDTKAGAVSINPSIEDYKNIVINRVDEFKKRGSHQQADLYSPQTMNERLIPIFDPQPGPSEKLAAGVPGGAANPQ
jgi:hypothetical protein